MIITKIGIEKMLSTLINGNKIVFGSGKVSTGTSTNNELTELPGTILYNGNASDLSFAMIDGRTMIVTFTMDDTVGTFDYQSFGIYLNDGTLFAYASLPAVSRKTARNMPGVLGDIHRRSMRLTSNSISTMIETANVYRGINTVATFSALPPPGQSQFPFYIIGSSRQLAVTNGTEWILFNPSN